MRWSFGSASGRRTGRPSLFNWYEFRMAEEGLRACGFEHWPLDVAAQEFGKVAFDGPLTVHFEQLLECCYCGFAIVG